MATIDRCRSVDTTELFNSFREVICDGILDIQQFFLLKDITGTAVSKGLSLRSWFIVVVAGKGLASVDSMNYPLEKGSLLMLRPGDCFHIDPDSGNCLSYYAVGYAYGNRKQPDIIVNKINPLSGCVKMHNTIRIENRLKDMHRLSLGGNLQADPEIKSTFYSLMASFCTDIRQSPNNPAIYRRIEKATDFIYENYDQKIGIEDLAELCGISKEYFIRAFKSRTGTPPGQFIINVRMNKAKEMLMAGNRKIREIALLTGFKDEFYFSKLFKRQVGICPSSYSKKNIY